jgi:glucose/arabinose dehydrogenase
MKHKIFLTVITLSSFVAIACFTDKRETNLDDKHDINLPDGFEISLFSSKVPGARSLALGDNGTVFIGARDNDNVYALRDEDGDGKAEIMSIVAKNMDGPNGVAFHNGTLYIAEVDKIWKIDNVETNLKDPAKPTLVFDKLPSDKHHGWKYIAFGPDNKLYIPIGAPCNICDNSMRDKRYASMCRMNADGSGFEIFADGIRNTVGFDWHPSTKELWFTDNGRDMMGDDIPPDELNVAPAKGLHFGYPYCHGTSISDPEFGSGKSCTDYTAPVVELAPHTAALGMKFYTGKMFPPKYNNSVFIAEHGSWNRSQPIGYRVTVVRKQGEKYIYEPFAEGWLKNGGPTGRPVDVLQLKDGSLLVSDDMGGKVYRISYKK